MNSEKEKMGQMPNPSFFHQQQYHVSRRKYLMQLRRIGIIFNSTKSSFIQLTAYSNNHMKSK